MIGKIQNWINFQLPLKILPLQHERIFIERRLNNPKYFIHLKDHSPTRKQVQMAKLKESRSSATISHRPLSGRILEWATRIRWCSTKNSKTTSTTSLNFKKKQKEGERKLPFSVKYKKEKRCRKRKMNTSMMKKWWATKTETPSTETLETCRPPTNRWWPEKPGKAEGGWS